MMKVKEIIKINLKFINYKNCLKASKIVNIINYLEKKEDKTEFIKNRLISKTQERLKSEKYNVFTENINKIALSSNDDKRIQSIDSIETYAHGISKDLTWKKEKN